MLKIQGFDHFVLTVASIERTAEFYERVLGMEKVVFAEGRVGLVFGPNKINLHEAGSEFKPHADRPLPGSGDFCLIVDEVETAKRHVEAQGVEVFQGPVPRSGARGPITSIYIRDPDGNLIELAEYS